MKHILVVFYLTLGLAPKVSASSGLLKNCLAEPDAQYFISDNEAEQRMGKTQIMLLDVTGMVVGAISAFPYRRPDSSEKVKQVNFHKLSLCSSLNVSDFYYADEPHDNVLKWWSDPQGSVTLFQDEGIIVLTVTLERAGRGANLMRAEFVAYEVDNRDGDEDEDNTPSAELAGHPDYKEDWGLPKGKGVFYYYLPKDWEIGER